MRKSVINRAIMIEAAVKAVTFSLCIGAVVASCSHAHAALAAKPSVSRDPANVSLVVVLDGDAYVVDTGMTMADCKRAMSMVKTFTVVPGVIASMSDTTARACISK